MDKIIQKIKDILYQDFHQEITYGRLESWGNAIHSLFKGDLSKHNSFYFYLGKVPCCRGYVVFSYETKCSVYQFNRGLSNPYWLIGEFKYDDVSDIFSINLENQEKDDIFTKKIIEYFDTLECENNVKFITQ
jgi:hypothetical protein